MEQFDSSLDFKQTGQNTREGLEISVENKN